MSYAGSSHLTNGVYYLVYNANILIAKYLSFASFVAIYIWRIFLSYTVYSIFPLSYSVCMQYNIMYIM